MLLEMICTLILDGNLTAFVLDHKKMAGKRKDTLRVFYFY